MARIISNDCSKCRTKTKPEISNTNLVLALQDYYKCAIKYTTNLYLLVCCLVAPHDHYCVLARSFYARNKKKTLTFVSCGANSVLILEQDWFLAFFMQ